MIKRIFIFSLLFIGAGLFFAGCEKADYQNPFHRAAKNR